MKSYTLFEDAVLWTGSWHVIGLKHNRPRLLNDDDPGNSIPSTPVVCPNELMWNQSCEYSLITQDDPGQCVINFKT